VLVNGATWIGQYYAHITTCGHLFGSNNCPLRWETALQGRVPYRTLTISSVDIRPDKVEYFLH
jgi:hypothetical protein